MLKANKIKIPWGAWYKDSSFELSFPDNWEIDLCNITDALRLDNADILKAFQKPFGTLPLRQIAQKGQKAVVAVEDITRPARLARVLKIIINELLSAGLKKTDIKFIICNGAHAPMLRSDMILKLGQDIVKNYLVLNHNPYDNLAETKIVLGKTLVKVNQHFLAADIKIGVGSIIPHSFAGFSSGGKLILPGLSDISTLERSHKYVMMGFRGGVNDVETNKFRMELEDVASQIGLDFFVGIVPNSHREIAGVFTGDLVNAHRAGVDFARKIYHTKISSSYDAAILNTYPKDSELLQADTGLTPLKTTKSQFIKKDGALVITSCCSNGFGYHSLFGPGMRLSRKPIKRRYLQEKHLIVFSPDINMAEFQCLYWDGYNLANDWQTVINLLEKHLEKPCPRILVLPWAPLQLLSCPI